MDYVRLGKSGLKVSRLCLGCMTYGVPERGGHPWTMPEDQSRPLIKKAIDLGINFLDTANNYSDGTSEEFIGRAVKDFGKRDDFVIATKGYFSLREVPNNGGLSRKAIFQQVDASLKRLGMDYVDLYQIHRWDFHTPIEETMEALHDIVKSGRARYIGASTMATWQFAKAQYTADLHGWTRFVSMQNHLNLLYREEEREMMPFCGDQGIGVIPWSPMARGRLTRDWNETNERVKTDSVGKMLYDKNLDADRAVIEAVAALAKTRDVSRAQVALAWVLQKPGVTAPIIGASKAQHLDDAMAALTLNLTSDEIKKLESAYAPRHVTAVRQ